MSNYLVYMLKYIFLMVYIAPYSVLSQYTSFATSETGRTKLIHTPHLHSYPKYTQLQGHMINYGSRGSTFGKTSPLFLLIPPHRWCANERQSSFLNELLSYVGGSAKNINGAFPFEKSVGSFFHPFLRSSNGIVLVWFGILRPRKMVHSLVAQLHFGVKRLQSGTKRITLQEDSIGGHYLLRSAVGMTHGLRSDL